MTDIHVSRSLVIPSGELSTADTLAISQKRKNTADVDWLFSFDHRGDVREHAPLEIFRLTQRESNAAMGPPTILDCEGSNVWGCVFQELGLCRHHPPVGLLGIRRWRRAGNIEDPSIH